MKRLIPTLKLSTINSIAIIVTFLLLLYVLIRDSEKNRLTYVDNLKLFKEFTMSKDMEKQYNDSIKSQLKKVEEFYDVFQKSIELKFDESVIAQNQVNFQKENEKLEAMQNYFSNEVSQMVWDRLNSYIKEYGKQKKYKLILGTQGSGNIMYADSLIDVSEEIIKYCNERYEGNSDK